MKKSVKLIVVMLSLLADAAAAATIPFTANGSWTVPAGVTSITIEVWGGGGGGGGNTTTADGGGGGGGGAYSRTANVAVTPGEVCTVTIGAGGAGGVLLTLWVGAAGGQSLVSCSGGASVSAAGGAGGSPPVGGLGGVGGAGGAAGGGAVTFAGGNGGTGRNNNTGRGGPGGSSAGNAANGTSGPNPWATLTAAAPPAGGGIGGNGGSNGQNGFAPASGNGGGGGGSGDGLARSGGSGARGKAIIGYATAPIVTTNAATALLSDGATLNGVVDDGGADTATAFEYGLTAAYGSTAVATPSPLPANSGNTAVSAVVSGLICNTTYHFRATGVNLVGAGYGGDLTFTTAACPPLVYVFTDSVCLDGVPFGTPGQCALVAWSPRTAGQALGNIYLTRVNGSMVPSRVNATRSFQFALSCHDPVASAGVQATLTYQALAPTTVALPACQGGGAQPTIGSAVWNVTPLAVTFPNRPSSEFPFSFSYDDVGKVELWINRSGRPDLGYTGPFVVKPAGFALSDIRQTAAPNLVNPAAADAAGLKFVKAGEAFSATVTALTASGKIKADAGTPVNCATVPADCTPNYGNEIIPESVKLEPALAGLGLTNNPALTCSDAANATICDTTTTPGVNIPRFSAFSNGVATGVNFAWNEVGIITLTPHVGDLDYLAAGDVAGTTTGHVGRFTLAKFALQNVALVNRADYCQGGFGVTLCTPAFTYMGEQIDAEFTLRPQSLNGTPVLNYVDSATVANDFAKFDPTIFADLNVAAVDRMTTGGPYYLSARVSNTAMPAVSCTTIPCFQAGGADVTVPFALSRATEDGPYGAVEIGIGLAESDGARVEGAGAIPGLCNNPNESDCYDLDSDAVAGNDRALLGATEFRYGRIKVSNAYGSELLPLTLVATAQYYTATGWVNSINDTVTDLNVAASYAVGAGSSSTTVTPSSGVLDNGLLNILLAKPSGGATGTATVAPTVVGCVDPATCYLPVTAGTATFGVYKSKNPFIYRREAY